MDALPAFQQKKKKYSPTINNESMHSKVDSTIVPDTFKIALAPLCRKTKKFGVLISLSSKIDKDSPIESYKASVSSKLHSIQVAAIDKLCNLKVINGYTRQFKKKRDLQKLNMDIHGRKN